MLAPPPGERGVTRERRGYWKGGGVPPGERPPSAAEKVFVGAAATVGHGESLCRRRRCRRPLPRKMPGRPKQMKRPAVRGLQKREEAVAAGGRGAAVGGGAERPGGGRPVEAVAE